MKRREESECVCGGVGGVMGLQSRGCLLISKCWQSVQSMYSAAHLTQWRDKCAGCSGPGQSNKVSGGNAAEEEGKMGKKKRSWRSRWLQTAGASHAGDFQPCFQNRVVQNGRFGLTSSFTSKPQKHVLYLRKGVGHTWPWWNKPWHSCNVRVEYHGYWQHHCCILLQTKSQSSASFMSFMSFMSGCLC